MSDVVLNDQAASKVLSFIRAAEKHPKAARFALQAVAYDLLPNSRLRVCHRVPAPAINAIDVYYREKTCSARYGGLMKCALAWVCPLCALRIAEIRRDELNRAFDHARGHYEPFLATFTVRHNASDPLGNLLAGIIAAYRSMSQQRAWRTDKEEFGIEGAIRATEITRSDDAGWHPHFHVLLFVDASLVGERVTNPDGSKLEPPRYSLSKPDREYYAGVLERRLWEHWLIALEKHGLSAMQGPGVKVEPGEFAQYYVAKYAEWSIGHELTSQYRKQARKPGGETVWDLLLRHWAGDEKAAGLFLEYFAATKGKSQLQWSPGLRELLKSPDKSSDPAWWDDLADDEVLLMTLSIQDWQQVNRYGAEGELLDRASTGDAERVYALLSDLYSRSSI